MQLPNEIVKKLTRYFEREAVLRAYIFGSYARNEANEQSDVDILLELDYSKKIGLGFVDMKFDIEDIVSAKVDLLTSNSLSPYLKPLVEKEMVLIYERH
jgi:uncharacterized protein